MSLIEALCAKLMFETHVWLLDWFLPWIMALTCGNSRV